MFISKLKFWILYQENFPIMTKVYKNWKTHNCVHSNKALYIRWVWVSEKLASFIRLLLGSSVYKQPPPLLLVSTSREGLVQMGTSFDQWSAPKAVVSWLCPQKHCIPPHLFVLWGLRAALCPRILNSFLDWGVSGLGLQCRSICFHLTGRHPYLSWKGYPQNK